MSVGYRLAYRLGLTPWEQAGAGFGPQLSALLETEEGHADGPHGKALDVGCGSGDHSIELAQRGWQVTGVDFVPAAIEKARAKAAAAGVEVSFVEGDATRLAQSAGTGYRLLLDIGCFHGLKDDQRADYAKGASAVTDAGGTLLIFAFGPGRRGPLPRGVAPDDLATTLAGWTLEHEELADTSGMPGPLKKSEPRWYRFVRGTQ